MTYAEQIQDVRWQKRRLKILERDDFKCQAKCNNPNKFANVQVHHLDYFPSIMIWEYPDDMLVTLCDKCHLSEKYRAKITLGLAIAFKAKEILYEDLVALTALIYTDAEFLENLKSEIRKIQNG